MLVCVFAIVQNTGTATQRVEPPTPGGRRRRIGAPRTNPITWQRPTITWQRPTITIQRPTITGRQRSTTLGGTTLPHFQVSIVDYFHVFDNLQARFDFGEIFDLIHLRRLWWPSAFILSLFRYINSVHDRYMAVFLTVKIISLLNTSSNTHL